MKTETATAFAKTPCHWLKTATAIFRRVAYLPPATKPRFFSGSGNAEIYLTQGRRILVAYSGKDLAEAQGIFDALRELHRQGQVAIENFEAVDDLTFLLQAKIL